jgi:hypothetical protein
LSGGGLKISSGERSLYLPLPEGETA